MTATRPFQGLSIDFGFSGTRSKDDERRIDFEGFNGETCWCIIKDHFSRRVYGETFVSKAPPSVWLQDILSRYSPNIPGKYCFLDQGGDLAQSHEIQRILKQYQYDIRITGADNS